ncbi:hypothetical protein Acsp03_21160 [Actinomadura sp. NBRC 104412]|uniref:DUF1707 SHOCT-like domain-containing protein n=1 Tax=Actinomadura sp. NBRC 104412 TaxID=3032203 RepID=UPI0024A08CDC|nr:DUF1707 domain-containing protein [Actinomadura sp. NBRC 104412]GLZ04650.1 hypothetical protein Acsp03_21160 [Actinomadura sp. NBRC 104412]
MSQPTPQPGRRSQEPRSQLPADAPHRAAGAVRASDAEREAAVERLRVASVEGRLTFEELAERTEAAYLAVTRGDLDAVTADLPGMGAPGAAPAPAQVRRRFAAVMGDCTERIIGRVEQELEALAVMGDVVLDLRGAQVPSGEVNVVATAVMGDVKVIVPDGVVVEMNGYCVLGERKVMVREAGSGARVPVVRIRANVIMGDVKIVDDEHHSPVRRAIAGWWEQRRTGRDRHGRD